MTRSVELSALDLRYESYRMRNPAVEARLLASIAERGIEEALEGVDADGASILLNGFKRYRCAAKLRIHMAPYASLGEDEAAAIVTLLRVSNDRSLTILEQARFIEELRQRNALSVADIAGQLSREQVLGEHAAGSDGRDEHRRAGETLQWRVSGLSLHVHLTAVHAHERCPQAGHRRLCGGAGRQEAQRARGGTTGARIFSRAGLVSRGDPARARGLGVGLVAASARRPGWLQ